MALKSILIRIIHVGLHTLLVLAVVIPFLPLLLTSISAGWQWPELWPQTLTTRAWEYVFSSSELTWMAIYHSFVIALTVTLINLCLAIPAAEAIARHTFKGKLLVEGILYAPLIVPALVSVMGIHMAFIRLGLTDSLVGVILVHISPTLPYMIRALIVSFRTLDFSWEHQGRMLGAGRFGRYRYIILPHILPGIITGASLSILISLSQYLITFLIGGGQVITLPLILFPFISSGDPAIGAVYSLLLAGMGLCALWLLHIGLNVYYGRKLGSARSKGEV
jgi:putative spermidine/putrescine transport system permease protein